MTTRGPHGDTGAWEHGRPGAARCAGARDRARRDGVWRRDGELHDRTDELPDEPAAPLAIYCRSGAMSEDASRTLAGLGDTDVVDLRGGMNAWTASGQDLRPS